MKQTEWIGCPGYGRKNCNMVKDKGDIEGNIALKEAFDLGLSIK